jgi:hypothetical protein
MQINTKTKTEEEGDQYFSNEEDNDDDLPIRRRGGAAPAAEKKDQPLVRRVAEGELENMIKFEIKNIVDFKVCLESVKFPTSVKSRFNDVILQVQSTGIVLKSAAKSGNIMTRCMIKQDFFSPGSYAYEIRNPN